MTLLPLHTGDPDFLIPWWWTNSGAAPILWTQELAQYQETIPEELVENLRRIRGKRDPRFLVMSAGGSTQILLALILAHLPPVFRILRVALARPYYMLLWDQLQLFPQVRVVDVSEEADIEVVTSPNNPTGELGQARSRAPIVIYDRAYDWPIYHSEPLETKNESITVFTASKAFGWGGLRLGWAFISERSLALKVQEILHLTGICPNSFSLITLQTLLQTNLNDFFTHHRRILLERHRALEQVLPYDLKKINADGPYAWLYYKEGDCTEYCRRYGISVAPGTIFGSDIHHARFSLIGAEEIFQTALSYWANS